MSSYYTLSALTTNSLGQASRGKFSVLSEKAMRLFNVSKTEEEKARRLGIWLLPTHQRAGKRNSMDTSIDFGFDP